MTHYGYALHFLAHPDPCSRLLALTVRSPDLEVSRAFSVADKGPDPS